MKIIGPIREWNWIFTAKLIYSVFQFHDGYCYAGVCSVRLLFG